MNLDAATLLNALQGKLPDGEAARLSDELAALPPGSVWTLAAQAGIQITGDGNIVGNNNISIVVKGEGTIALAAVLREALERGRALHQLPAPPRDFVGREQDLRELREGMAQGGVAISGLQGMGGVGKTALALKLAAELAKPYPDAGLYLDLKGVDPSPVSVAGALGHFIRAFHPTAQLPEDVAQLRAIFLSTLHGKRALLVLDNARDAAQVEPLLPPASCAVIVTSRRYFTVPGLVPQRLDALPPDDARKLLLKIASRIGECADEMARVLGYLPLALRLAAGALAQRPNLTPEAYLRRLADAPARLTLVEAPLRLSYDLLEAAAQARWRALAVFPDSFDDAATAAVWEMEADAATGALGDLLALGMVEWNEVTRRYRLHNLARDFAAASLSQDEAARDAANQRHATYYLRVLARADDLYLEGDDAILRGLKLFDDERANIEAGQLWAAAHAEQDEEAARLDMYYLDVGAYVLSLRQPPRKNIAPLEAKLAAARRLKNRNYEGKVLCYLGMAYADLGESRRAIEFFEQYLKIANEISGRYDEGSVLTNLGNAYERLGEMQRAIEYHEQALVVSREFGDRRLEGAVLGSLGMAYADLGESRRAIEFFEQQLVIVREIGDWRGESNALNNLGMAYADLSETRRAIEFYGQALTIDREMGNRRGEGTMLTNLANAYGDLGEMRRVIEYHEQALAIFREIGDRSAEGGTLCNLGVAYADLGKTRRSIEFFEQALVVLREIGDRHFEVNTLGNLGSAYAVLGEMRRAIEFFEQALVISREIGDRRGEGNALWNMSLALNALGEGTQTVELAVAALAIYEQIEDPNAAMVRRALAMWRAARERKWWQWLWVGLNAHLRAD